MKKPAFFEMKRTKAKFFSRKAKIFNRKAKILRLVICFSKNNDLLLLEIMFFFLLLQIKNNNKQTELKQVFWYIILILIVIGLFVVAIFFGSVDISNFSKADMYIIYNIRLPRAIMCLICGAGLAVCGATYQVVFKNPLSDPYILGISSGASLGATLIIVFGLDFYLMGVTLGAFVMALLTVVIIMKLSAVGNKLHSTTLLLAGVCINFLFSAIISILMFIDQEDMHKIYFWTMGSLSGAKFTDCLTVGVMVLLSICTLILYSKRMNVLLLGSLQANSLGIDAQRTKKIILFVATLCCSVIVSVCGVIGFVGLVSPHIARLLFGGDNRKVLPYSVLIGMIFMLCSDIIARNMLSPAELPIGSVTSLVGAPFFIYLLYNAKKKLRF